MENHNDKKLRIAMLCNNLSLNGISTVIMNYCSYIDLDKFEIDILAGIPISSVYEKKCKELGIRIISLPERKVSTAHYYSVLMKTLKKRKYDIVHVHGNSATISIELMLAKLSGTKIRIAHSHNTTCSQMKAHKLLLPLFNQVCTHGFACGEDAGKWLYGDRNFEVIPNGFITERFVYSRESREKVRNELNIEDKFVVGHIGRINEQKNQPYLLRIFEQIARTREDAVLLMVGIGPDYEKIKKMVEQHQYRDRIILYGESKDTPAMYSAFDVFVLPSKYEGLPVVLLEAQISGLPCVVSDKVTREVDFGDFVWASIEDNPSSWADKICTIAPNATNRVIRVDSYKEKIDGYDIRKNAKQLEHLYETIYEDISQKRK